MAMYGLYSGVRMTVIWRFVQETDSVDFVCSLYNHIFNHYPADVENMVSS